jgi:hypothetical protein
MKSISISNILYEINKSKLEDKIEDFQKETNYTDWYVSGGCYNFALAILNIIPSGKVIAISDAIGEYVHVAVEYNGMYIDYSGITKNKKNLLDNISTEGDVKWSYIKPTLLKKMHNYSSNEVTTITKFFTV